MMRPKITFRLACLAILCASPLRRRASSSRRSSRSRSREPSICPANCSRSSASRCTRRVAGYVERVLVDRGSKVETGQLLVELSAPEMTARIAEAESKDARGRSRSTAGRGPTGRRRRAPCERLKKAAETPGAVAGNETVQAEKQVEAAQALVEARQQAVRAAEAGGAIAKGHGAVSEDSRAVRWRRHRTPGTSGRAGGRHQRSGAADHPAGVASPAGRCGARRIRGRHCVRGEGGISRSGISGANLHRHGRTRLPTRSMRRRARCRSSSTSRIGTGSLSPGMYPTVKWPVRRSTPALFVPKTSVVTTTERTFVIRDQNGRAEWVDVKKGAADGDCDRGHGQAECGRPNRPQGNRRDEGRHCVTGAREVVAGYCT